jgi:DNA repair protein SbcD/Mre11
MRLIHTADWHLGRLFHTVHLTRDQEQVLEQLVALVAEVRPSAVLVAGDIYDRAVPPTEAVELLDDVLTRIVVGQGVPVIAISGNHDSATRLGFASRMLRERGLHVIGELPREPAPVVLTDEHGPLHVHPLPFADPADARYAYDDDTIHDQAAVAAAGVARVLAATPTAERRIAVAHAFVAGAEETPDSERPLSVGGSTQVPAAVFDGFDYVALGHLHRPQPCGADTVRYAGSLMKYSFSEHDHTKSVSVVDIGAPGSASGAAGVRGRARAVIETITLTPPRDVRRLMGTLAEILALGRTDPQRDDYVLAALLDKGALLDPIGQLRSVYPNALAIERPVYDQTGSGDERRPRPGAVGDLDLFDAFFSYASGDSMSTAQRAQLAAVIDALERGRREAVP